MTLREYKKTTSNRQFGYYYGVVLPLLCEVTGNTKEEQDFDCKQRFGLKRIVIVKNLKGEEVEHEELLSKTKYTTKGFEDYLVSIRRAALVEAGLYIPLPNEVDIPDFYTTY